MKMRKLMAGAFLSMTVSSCIAAASPGQRCLADLDNAVTFFLENDAGGTELTELKGPDYVEFFLATSRKRAQSAANDAICNQVIRDYLHSWRKEHLYLNKLDTKVEQVTQAVPNKIIQPLAQEKLPRFREISALTVMLTIPTFNGRYKNSLRELIEANRAALESHPNWIIDVRGNGGGDDSTYQSLTPWLISEEILEVGAALYVTPANAAAQTAYCDVSDAECIAEMSRIAEQMRAAPSGQFIPQDPTHPDGIYYSREESLEPRRPSRVAILIDRGCGSSCEQFLLAARQSFTVKLVGQRTGGGLDYSNLRRHKLPSGIRELVYATSRSYRLPHLLIDAAGVMPDVYLPPETAQQSDMAIRVKTWLEGGTLRP